MTQPVSEPHVTINILVVDDDSTCLSLISGYLQGKHHNVVATRNPLDALCTLKLTWQSFDLILTDVHMPEMSGLQLLNHTLEEEFKVPLVLMSTDNDLGIMEQGLREGASHYFLKPSILEALDRIWQFALPTNPNKNLSSPLFRETKLENDKGLNSDHNFNNNSIINNNNSTALATNPNEIDEVLRLPGGRRKAKIIWTPCLHNQFLEAVNKLGVDKAVPKKILEYMNVEGLKRENVASHLQKYRIFLKRISEPSSASKEEGTPNNWHERPFRSSFMLNEISVLTNNLQQQYQQLFGQSQGKGTSTHQVTPPPQNVAAHDDEAVIHIVESGVEQAAQNAPVIATNKEEPPSLVKENIVQDTISITISTNEAGVIQNPTDHQPAKYNYIGLRLNCNGELFGPLNGNPIKPNGNNIYTNDTNSGGANQDVNVNIDKTQNCIEKQNINDDIENQVTGDVTPEVNNCVNYVTNENTAYTSSNEVPANMCGPENQDNASPQEPAGLSVSHEIPSSNSNIAELQDIFGSVSSFGAFDIELQGSDFGSFEGFDQGALGLNNDFTIDYNYLQEYEQRLWDFTQDGSFEITQL